MINVLDMFKKPVESGFAKDSITDAYCGKNTYTWSGANSISTLELLNGNLNDYNLSGGADRTGSIHDVQDVKRTYVLPTPKAFREFFDDIHVHDTGFIRQATVYMKQMTDNVCTPYFDRYRLSQWANGAGLGTLNSTQLDKDTVVKAILNASAEMNDVGVPSNDRVCYIRSDIGVELAVSGVLTNSQAWIDKRIIRGKIGEIDGMPIVSTPKSYFPDDGIEFMIKYRNATADPFELRKMKTNEDPSGRFGTEMEGLFYFGSFVLGSMSNGVYVYAASGVLPAPTISVSSNVVTISAGSGVSGTTIKYTTDGSDPKTSNTAQTYSSTITITADTKFRAYQSKTGSVNSPIKEYTAVYSA